MKIIVFNEKTIKKYKTDLNYAVISIQDPTQEFVKLSKPKNCKGIFRLKFYDFDTKTGQPHYDVFLFDLEDARHIINAYELIKDKVDVLCVNCVAGISRSAGVAAALSKIHSEDDSYYFKHYCPNSLVYSLILNEYYNGKKNFTT